MRAPVRLTRTAVVLIACCGVIFGAAPAAASPASGGESGSIAITVESAISLTVIDTASEPTYAVSTNSPTGYAVSLDTRGGVLTITAGIG